MSNEIDKNLVHFCLYHHISNWVVVVIGRNISNRKLSICVERDHVFTQQRATWWLYNIIRINLLKCCNCCCSCFQKRNVDCHVTSICSLLFLTCRVARARHRRAFICWEKREATNIASTHLGCCWTAHHVAFHLARSSLHAFTHVPAIAVQRCCTCLDTVRVVAHVARGTETRWQRNICIVKKKKKTWLTTRLAANWEWLISLFIILRILYNCTWWYREKYLDWIYVFRVPVPRLMIENDQERGHPNKGRPQLPTTQRNISAT